MATQTADRDSAIPDLPLPPHHAPQNTQSSNSSSAPSVAAVPRSSSFTRSKRFLTGEGLSAREALGIIDEPDAPAVEERASQRVETFDLARAALSSILCVESSNPPPPPPVNLSAEQRRVLSERVPPIAPPLSRFVDRLSLPAKSWVKPEYDFNDRVPVVNRSGVKQDLDKFNLPLPSKYDPNKSLDSHSKASVGMETLKNVDGDDDVEVNSEPENEVQITVQPLASGSGEKDPMSEEKPKLSTRLSSPRNRKSASGDSPETKSKLSARLQSLRNAKNTQDDNSDSKPKLSLGKLSMGSDKAKRKSRPLSPLVVGNRIRKAAKTFAHEPAEDDHPDDLAEAQPSGAQTLSPSRSKTVAKLRNLFTSRFSAGDDKIEAVRPDITDEGDTDPASSEKVEECEEQRSVSKEEKSSASAEDTVPSCSSAQSSPNKEHVSTPNAKADSSAARPHHRAYPSDDSAMSDIADEAVHETRLAPNRAATDEQHLSPNDRRERSADQNMEIESHSPGTDPRPKRPTAISLPPRNDQPLRIHHLTPESSPEQFEDASEEQIPAFKKDSARKRRDFFKRFRAVQDGSSPQQAAKLGAEHSGQNGTGGTVIPLQRAEDKPVPENATSRLPQFRRRVEVIAPSISLSDDNVSFMSANEEFSPPSKKQNQALNTSRKGKEGINSENSPQRSLQTSQNSPTVESLTASSSVKSQEDRQVEGLGAPNLDGREVALPVIPTPSNQFELPLPQTVPSGVSAQGFLDGPVCEPVQEDNTASIKNRKDSHHAFLFSTGDENARGKLGKNVDGKDQSGSPGKTGLQKRLAKAKEAGSVIVSKAKKIPRGKSLPRLRVQDGQIVESRDGAVMRTKSNVGQGTGVNIKPEDFGDVIPVVDGIDEVGMHEPSPYHTEASRTANNGARQTKAGAATKRAADGQKEKPKPVTKQSENKTKKEGKELDESQRTPRKKEKSVPEYVTVQRVIRQVRADGSVEVIRRQIRLKPLQILPNGDVVVRRPMKRMKDDGSGFELLNVTQIIPCRKTKKRAAEPERTKRRVDEYDEANEASSLPDLSTLNRPERATKDNSEEVEAGAADDGQMRLKDRAFSMPSSSVINKKGPGPSTILASKPRRSRSTHIPGEREKEVRFQMPRSSSASAVDTLEKKSGGGRRSRLLDMSIFGSSDRDREGRRTRGRLWPLAARVLTRQKNDGEERRRTRGHGRN